MTRLERPADHPIPGRDSTFDIVLIGAGAVGSAIARVLSQYRCTVAVIEKESDVGMAASSRNSGVIHAGINYEPGTRRARFCMEGRTLLQTWCDELNIPYRICGKLIVAQSKCEINALKQLEQQGDANGVPDLQIVTGAEAAVLQPGIESVAALHVPSSGIVSPYALTIAMAEDAAVNGVCFFLGSAATGIEETPLGFAVHTTAGVINGRWLINCAGIHAGHIARFLVADAPTLYPCVGEYLLLDKHAGEQLTMSVYPAPQSGGAGLGVHITPTTEGNVLLGPSNEYVSDLETVCCTQDIADRLLNETRTMWPDAPTHLVIGAYAGVRAKLTPPEVGGFDDYVFLQTSNQPRAIHLLGIESPGLTAAPGIARYLVEEIVRRDEPFQPKSCDEMHVRRWPTRFDELTEEEKGQLVKEDPNYGDIVCRCEGVTKHELLHALHNPLGVRTLSGIKFRSRVSMGRCSGGYCLPRMVEILQQEYGWTPDAFQLRGPASPAFHGSMIEEAQ